MNMLLKSYLKIWHGLSITPIWLQNIANLRIEQSLVWMKELNSLMKLSSLAVWCLVAPAISMNCSAFETFCFLSHRSKLSCKTVCLIKIYRLNSSFLNNFFAYLVNFSSFCYSYNALAPFLTACFDLECSWLTVPPGAFLSPNIYNEAVLILFLLLWRDLEFRGRSVPSTRVEIISIGSSGGKYFEYWI